MPRNQATASDRFYRAYCCATLTQVVLAASTTQGVWQTDPFQRLKNALFVATSGAAAVMTADTPVKKVAAGAMAFGTLAMMGLNEIGLGFSTTP